MRCWEVTPFGDGCNSAAVNNVALRWVADMGLRIRPVEPTD